MLLYLSNSCEYCIHSHTAAARAYRMINEHYAPELLSIVFIVGRTNSLLNGIKVPIDKEFNHEK